MSQQTSANVATSDAVTSVFVMFCASRACCSSYAELIFYMAYILGKKIELG